MSAYLHPQSHLLHELPFETVACPFAEFKSTPRKFGNITTSDEFVADQHPAVFPHQDAIYSYIDHVIDLDEKLISTRRLFNLAPEHEGRRSAEPDVVISSGSVKIKLHMELAAQGFDIDRM